MAEDILRLYQELKPQQKDSSMVDHLTILASECRLYPDGEDDPLLVPLTGGPGIPGMLGTVFTGLASYALQQTPIQRQIKGRGREKGQIVYSILYTRITIITSFFVPFLMRHTTYRYN